MTIIALTCNKIIALIGNNFFPAKMHQMSFGSQAVSGVPGPAGELKRFQGPLAIAEGKE